MEGPIRIIYGFLDRWVHAPERNSGSRAIGFSSDRQWPTGGASATVRLPSIIRSMPALDSRSHGHDAIHKSERNPCISGGYRFNPGASITSPQRSGPSSPPLTAARPTPAPRDPEAPLGAARGMDRAPPRPPCRVAQADNGSRGEAEAALSGDRRRHRRSERSGIEGPAGRMAAIRRGPTRTAWFPSSTGSAPRSRRDPAIRPGGEVKAPQWERDIPARSSPRVAPKAEVALRGRGRDRRQQVQGGEQPRRALPVGDGGRGPGGQVSLTDPDAGAMASSGKGTGIVGYNVQTAVDAHT